MKKNKPKSIDKKPEPKLDKKVEVKPEKKPEVKPEIKQEIKQEIKPEIKQEVKPEIKQEVKPEIKQELKPEKKLEGKESKEKREKTRHTDKHKPETETKPIREPKKPDVVNKDDKPMKSESIESHPDPVIAQPVNVKVDPISGPSIVEINHHKEPPKETFNPFDNPFDFSSTNSKDDFLFGGVPEENIFDYDIDADPFSFTDAKVNLSILEPKDTFGFDITKLPFGGDDLFVSSSFPTTFSFTPSNDPIFS